MRFMVLPRLADAAVQHFSELHELKRAARQKPLPRRETGKRAKLSEREPW